MKELAQTTPESAAEARPTQYRKPYYTVRDEPEAFAVQVYLPGVGRQGVEVSLTHDLLTVTGTRTQLPPAEWRPLQRETRGENFRLQLQLNVEIDAEHIAARTEDGVLSLRLPKAERVRSRTIAIE